MANKSTFSRGKPHNQKIEGIYETQTFSLSDSHKQLLKEYSELTGKTVSKLLCTELIDWNLMKKKVEDLKK